MKNFVFAVTIFTIFLGTPSAPLFAGDTVSYLEDPFQKWEFPDIRNRLGLFESFDSFRYDTESDEIVVWIRIPVINRTDREEISFLDVHKGLFWKAELYVTDIASEQIYSYRRYSVLDPGNDPLETVRTVGFPFSIPSNSERLLYLRLKTYDIAGVRFVVRSAELHFRRLMVEHVTSGILPGILFGLLVYNLVIFRSLREFSYAFFFAFLVTAILYVLTVRRIGTGLLQTATGIEPFALSGALAVTALVFLVLFTRRYLDTAATMPTLHRVLTVLLILAPVTILANLFDFPGSSILDWLVIFSTILTMGVAGITGMVRGRTEAAAYSGAIIFFLIGSVLSFLFDLGFRSRNAPILLQDSVQYGVVLTAILLSGGISLQIRTLREDRLRLSEMNEAKTRLLAVASHELRTPLTNLQLMVEGAGRPDGRMPSVAAMDRQIQRLSSYVENLLAKSHLEMFPDHASMHPTDVVACVENCVTDFGPRAEAAGIVLSGPSLSDPGAAAESLFAYLDMHTFPSVISNLLDNAIRATPTKGTVTVRVTARAAIPPEQTDRVVISVRDSGPGMRVDAPGHHHGLGLGLSLAREIVDRHGGSFFEDDASPAPGAHFTVYLPRTNAPDETGRNPKIPPDTSGRPLIPDSGTTAAIPVILLVDDDPDLRENLTVLLTPRFSVLAAGNTAEADRILSTRRVDAIVSDVMMPETDGFQWYRSIRSRDRYSSTPFLFLSALGDTETVLHGLDLGAVDYVRKPFSAAELSAKLAALIASRSALSDLLKADLLHHIRNWPGITSRPDDIDSGTTAHAGIEAARAAYNLTDRQSEVLTLVVQGYTNREIADLLKLSVKTVNYHVSALLEKVGVDRRTQLAFELGHGAE